MRPGPNPGAHCIRSQAWPVDNAQNELQVLCRHRSLPTPHFFDDPSTAKGVAGVDCLVLHAFVHFLRPIDFPAVGKRYANSIADRVWVFAFKGENVGQERFNTRVGNGHHRSPRS
jgi:hypothetical protein